MSYILDALQRANAERERGAVPGLHAQPLPAPDARRTMSAPVQLTVAMAAAVGAVALGALAVQLARPAPPPSPVQAVSAPASASIAQPAQAPETAKLVLPPAVVTATTAVSAPAVSQEALAAANAALRPAPAPAAAVAPKTTASAAAAPTAKNDRIYALNELPEDVRAQLPSVAISGASYSENVSQRLLIVNGNVVQERGMVAPEVVLEQIGERSAVLRFRDYRYRIGY